MNARVVAMLERPASLLHLVGAPLLEAHRLIAVVDLSLTGTALLALRGPVCRPQKQRNTYNSYLNVTIP